MEKEQKIKSDEIDLIGMLEKVWNERRFLIKFTLVIFLLGFVVALSIPKEYKSESKIVPEDTKEVKVNKANSFASLLGLGVDNALNTEISADLYPEIVKSTPYLAELANVKIQPDGLGEMSLFEYIMLHQKEAWWKYVIRLPWKIAGVFSEKEVWHNDTVWDSFKLTRLQRQFIRDLSDNIHVLSDQETGMITIHVYMQDPVVAAVVAEKVVQKLYSYIDSYRVQKAREEMRFVEEMYIEAHKTYDETQQRFLEFNKNHKSRDSSVSSQVDIDLAFGFYNMMAQQYEMAKVNVMKKRPIFTVIEPAMIPLNAAAPRKTLILLLSIALGLFVGVIWVFVKDAFVK